MAINAPLKNPIVSIDYKTCENKNPMYHFTLSYNKQINNI